MVTLSDKQHQRDWIQLLRWNFQIQNKFSEIDILLAIFVVYFWVPQCKKDWTYWSESPRYHQDGQGVEHTTRKLKSTDLGVL